MKKYYCDKCGEEILTHNAVGPQHAIDDKLNMWGYLITNNIDYCLNCYEKSCNIINKAIRGNDE